MDAVTKELPSWSKRAGEEEVVKYVSSGGRFLATAHGHKVILWDRQTGGRLHEIARTDIVGSVVLSPTGKFCAITELEQRVTIWAIEKIDQPQLTVGSIRPLGFAWSPDEEHFVITTDGGQVHLWNRTERLKWIDTLDRGLYYISWSSPTMFHTGGPFGFVRSFCVDQEWRLEDVAFSDWRHRRLIPGDPRAREIVIKDGCLKRKSSRGETQLACLVNPHHSIEDVSDKYVLTYCKSNFYFWPHNEKPPLSAVTVKVEVPDEYVFSVFPSSCRLLDDESFAYSMYCHIFVRPIPKP